MLTIPLFLEKEKRAAVLGLVYGELVYGRGRERKTGRENCKRRGKIGAQSPSTGPLISITSGALGLSSYACTHIHMRLLYLCPLLLNVPL